MTSGFLTLFKRGRYLRLLGDEESRRERERFTAAVIGFCIAHDPEFARTFWETICQAPGGPPPGRIQCLIEPKLWADLIVLNQTETGKLACVVELKLDQPLAKHQDPTEPDFAMETGYGRFVSDDRTVIGTPRRRFVVLGAVPSPDSSGKRSSLALPWQSHAWEALERQLPRTPMSQEFARLLAGFGVAAFRYRITKNMKMKTSLKEAAQAHMLLSDTASRLGFRIKPASWDIRATDPDDPDYWCYGIGIVVKDAGQQRAAFTKLLGERSDAKWFGWLGYEFNRQTEFHLLVELYAATSKVKRVERLLRACPESAHWEIDIASEGDVRTIRISGTARAAMSDSEWLQSVFRSVGIGS